MASYSAEDAKKRYEKLPPEIKNLLYSPGMSFTVQQIGEKNKLHIDQIDILNTEVGQLMLGFIDPKEFVTVLMEMLRLDKVQADAVVQDVNEMLLAPIRESMKKTYELNGASVEAAAPQNTAVKNVSVIMPSSVSISPTSPPLPPKVTPVAVSTPIAKPTPSTPTTTPIPTLKVPEMHAADLMLSEPTISMAPLAGQAKPTPAPSTPATVPSTATAPSSPASAAPAKVEAPKAVPPYKADPYREPPE